MCTITVRKYFPNCNMLKMLLLCMFLLFINSYFCNKNCIQFVEFYLVSVMLVRLGEDNEENIVKISVERLLWKKVNMNWSRNQISHTVNVKLGKMSINKSLCNFIILRFSVFWGVVFRWEYMQLMEMNWTFLLFFFCLWEPYTTERGTSFNATNMNKFFFFFLV